MSFATGQLVDYILYKKWLSGLFIIPLLPQITLATFFAHDVC